MSGVSVTSGTNLDLEALVAGGDTFIQRVKDFNDAKAKHEVALANLNIGKNAVAAYTDAQANQAAALKMVADAKTEAEHIVALAKQEAESIVLVARDTAATIVDAANKSSADIEQQVNTASKVFQAWSDKTKAEANDLLSRATIIKAQADQTLADNKKASSDLADAQASAKSAQDAANAVRAEFNTKLDAIKKMATS